MEALFRQYGIYSHIGQLYEPVDSESLTYYREARDGQLIEEGITEAGALSSFIAAGTAASTHGVQTLPFFVFYSMFGFQRVGDLIWAAGDQRTRGFLIGATAGRTTLNGEGLQHQDGHSHLLAYAHPHVVAYDPAFGYELAVILRAGLERLTEGEEDLIYYLTVQNEVYPMPGMPEGAEEGILRGLYRLREATLPGRACPALASGVSQQGVGGAKSSKRWGGRRRVEHHQLQTALHRRHRGRALEPPASGRSPADPLP
jgi:pyruvate dehydrogenase E1 component